MELKASLQFSAFHFLTLRLPYYFVFLFIQISQLVSDVQQLQVMQSRLKESGANEVECKLCKSFVIWGQGWWRDCLLFWITSSTPSYKLKAKMLVGYYCVHTYHSLSYKSMTELSYSKLKFLFVVRAANVQIKLPLYSDNPEKMLLVYSIKSL